MWQTFLVYKSQRCFGSLTNSSLCPPAEPPAPAKGTVCRAGLRLQVRRGGRGPGVRRCLVRGGQALSGCYRGCRVPTKMEEFFLIFPNPTTLSAPL